MRDDALEEWRRGWPVVVASMFGYGLVSVHLYAIGLFVTPLEREFGWSRAEITACIAMVSLASMLGAPLIGPLVDKWGPRRFALPGVVLYCVFLASISFSTSSIWSWWGLWFLLSLAVVLMPPSIWSAAVASFFIKKRGLALAVALTGTGLASSMAPIASNWLINQFGWRYGFVGLGALFGLIVIPVIFFFFHDAKDRRRNQDKDMHATVVELTGWTLKQGVRKRVFYQLVLAAVLNTFVVVGFIVSLVPILSEQGLDRSTAAQLAGMIGITSIIGRMTAGYFLDRFPGPPVAMIASLLPAIAAGIFLLFPGSTPAAMVAAAVLGLAVGGEYDAIMYLSTRYFGLRNYGALFGYVTSGLVVGQAIGPVVAGYLFDVTASYNIYLLMIVPLSVVISLLLGTLGKYPVHGRTSVTHQQPAAAPN